MNFVFLDEECSESLPTFKLRLSEGCWLEMILVTSGALMEYPTFLNDMIEIEFTPYFSFLNLT